LILRYDSGGPWSIDVGLSLSLWEIFGFYVTCDPHAVKKLVFWVSGIEARAIFKILAGFEFGLLRKFNVG
jgi:hypothetical protein